MSGGEEARAAVVALDRIVFHPSNIRRNLGDLRQLTASIELHGLLQPVVLERYGDYLRVRMGHRRVTAARLAGLKKVPALVHPVALDEEEFLFIALHENTVRRGLNFSEVRAAVQGLMALGCTQGDIAANLGVATSTVSKWSRSDLRAWADRPQSAHPQDPRVNRKVVGRLVEAWEDRLREGLTPAQGRDLLAELDAMANYEPRQQATGVERHHDRQERTA